MTRAKAYLASARPRTLPLSVAGVILGSMLAAGEGSFRGAILGWAIVTALALQVLANLANEVGDLRKGTDNEHRLGPVRSLQAGILDTRAITRAMIAVVAVAILSGCLLVRAAFGPRLDARGIALLLAGAAALVAAVKYTVGRHAYGYRGLGDLFVLIFFGWTSLLGTHFAMTGHLHLPHLLPATAIGCLSAGVLNLNNLRDITNDAAHGKRTLPVILGERRARVYHLALLATAIACLLAASLARHAGWHGYLFLLALPSLALHARAVLRHAGRALDPQLRLLSLITLLTALLAGIP